MDPIILDDDAQAASNDNVNEGTVNQQGENPENNDVVEFMELVIPPPDDNVTNENLIEEKPLKSSASALPSDSKQMESGSESDNEGQGCPICFEPWSNSGSHRLSSLNCGHLFGRSCIERWLKGKSSDKCPQCNCPAKRRDIRNIYCKTLKVIDTTERDKAIADLEEEKKRRTKAEEAHMRTMLQFEMVRAEMDRLKEQVKQQTYQYQQQLHHQNERLSSSQPSQGSTQAALRKSYIHQKTIQVAQNNARVMAFDRTHAMMAVSKPSPNQLFPGYGVVKVSSLESRTSEYVSIHQNVIRDVCFNSNGDQLLLSASVDKSLKLTSMASNTVVQRFKCPAPVWSCRWNETNSNFIYCGLQNGSCLVYDIRNVDSVLRSLDPPNGMHCPVVSLAYVSECSQSSFSAEGLLVGTLNGAWFWEMCPDSQYLPHPLNISQGSLTGLYFEEHSRHCMVSYRPSKNFSSTKHVIYKLTGSGIASATDRSLCSAVQVQQCIGGNISKVLSRAALFPCPDDEDKLFAAAGDEASKSTMVWDSSNGAHIQRISSPSPVLDVLAFTSNGGSFLAALTEQKLSINRWG